MFQGSMVALVTPMFADGSVDFASLDKLVELHAKAGTDAIVAVGTTGESATLNHAEHCEVVRFVVDKANDRLPVIAGTGSNSTSEALALGECAKKAGAAGTLVVTPYYNKPTQGGLFGHYKKLAEEVDLPMILYNVPGRTAVDMLPQTVARLAELPNVVGIKEASGSLQRIAELVSLCGEDFDVLSGDDDLALAATEKGCKGVISVTANVAPQRMHEIFQAALAGNREKAKALHQPLLALHRNLFLESNPIPVKWALHELGLIGTGIRLPMTELSDDKKPALRQALKEAQLL
ncbi:MAG TPA: 4-hydroxy-tetrahydrodipicolinate synthase [Gammaproteobacteria bacterium]|nr:4-hydroxy-tetrahydrodipicolinate synthase [Gammaproteobacteria bacterium]